MRPAVRPPTPTAWGARIVKLLFGLSVFGATIAGWAAVQHRALIHTPLPGAAGVEGPCALWLVGSSSMERWTGAPRDLAPWHVHNRGVGGALFPEITGRFASERTQPPSPGALIFYAGDNDLASGVALADAARQFGAFVAAAHHRFPAAPILVLSIKPSPLRLAQRPLQARYNAMLRAAAARDPRLTYVDVTAPMLAAGAADRFFGGDRLHLSAAGYAVWAQAVRAALTRRLPAGSEARCAATRV